MFLYEGWIWIRMFALIFESENELKKMVNKERELNLARERKRGERGEREGWEREREGEGERER